MAQAYGETMFTASIDVALSTKIELSPIYAHYVRFAATRLQAFHHLTKFTLLNLPYASDQMDYDRVSRKVLSRLYQAKLH